MTTTVTTSTAKGTVADSQRIVLALRDAGTIEQKTEIIVQIGVPTGGADYGVLIPVPGEPEIDPQPISMRDLEELDRITKPTITTVRPYEGAGGISCGCGSSGDDDAGGVGTEPAGAPATVSVSAPVEVGPATAVVLESDDGSALTAWLDQNGFGIPSEHQPIVDDYVARGDAFIAIRRSDTAPPTGPTSIGLHYTLHGDHRQLSLAFARIGAARTVAFTVFVLAPDWVRPAVDFTGLPLLELDENTLRQSYSKAVEKAVAAHGSRAFVMEGTYGRLPNGEYYEYFGQSMSQAFRDLIGLNPITAHNVTTRLSTVIAADKLDTDVRLDQPGDEVANVRLIPETAESSVGVLGLLLVARALRRRLGRRTRSAVMAALSLTLAFCPRPAEACGGGGVTPSTSSSSEKAAVADSQRIVLALHDAGLVSARTEIIAQIGVPGADSDYGVVIPVPGRPEIDPEPVSIKDLDALDQYTKPTVITQHYVYDDGDSSGSGCGCGSTSVKGGDDDASGADTAGSSADVSVSAPVNVGPATAVVLESDDGSALTAWLDDNGFAIPSEQQAIVDHYVELGDAFIAIRRNDTAPPDGPTSIGLHYTLRGDHRQLSFMFARIGAAPTVSFTVFVTAPTVSFPASPYAAIQLSGLSQDTLRVDYSKAVAEAVLAHDSHAFVMEGTYGAPLPATLSESFRELLGVDEATGNITTRASTIVAGETLDTDVRMDLQGIPVPNSVTLEPLGARLPRTSESSVGLLSLVLAARALRRRLGRRRNALPDGTPGRDLL